MNLGTIGDKPKSFNPFKLTNRNFSDFDKYSDLKKSERGLKKKYKKDNHENKQQLMEFYMSVLKCDRNITKLAAVDKSIILLNKINTDLLASLTLRILKYKEKIHKKYYDNYEKQEYLCDMTEHGVMNYFYKMRSIAEKIQDILRKAAVTTHRKDIKNLEQEMEYYTRVFEVINSFNMCINEFATQYKYVIVSLMPYSILVENIRTDLKIQYDKLKEKRSKLYNRKCIVLDQPEWNKIYDIFIKDKVTLSRSELNKLYKLIPASKKKALKYRIKTRLKDSGRKRLDVFIDDS